MASEVLVFDRSGTRLATFTADVARSWVLNDVGEATFTLPTSDEHCRQGVLEYGNLVVVRHEKVQPWVGVFYPPRDWGRFQVTPTAYSAELLLHFRRGIPGRRLTGTAGGIFEAMLEIANHAEDTLMRAGSIWRGGIMREETMETNSLLISAQRLAQRSGNEFGVEMELLPDGKLSLLAHWWQTRGAGRQYALIEGKNIEAGSTPWSEQGEIENDILGYGDGATWQSRPQYTALNAASRRRYGLMQGSVFFEGVTQPSTLQQNTESELRVRPHPRNTFRLSALDQDETWQQVRLGDTLPLDLHTVGFAGGGRFWQTHPGTGGGNGAA